MHDPSASQSLPRLGCFWGTFSPSRRQKKVVEVEALRWMPEPAAILARNFNDRGRNSVAFKTLVVRLFNGDRVVASDVRRRGLHLT
jgi:hypothetical protein